MAKPFDTILKTLLDAHAEDWAAYLAARVGVPFGPVSDIATDLSVSVQADKVFRIDGPTPALVHLEMESSSHLGVPLRLLRYNALLHHGTELPVHSVLMLLRPRANATDQTGEYTVPGADGHPYLRFRYHVVRVWEEPLARFLESRPGLAPLALLTNEAPADLPTAFDQFRDRLRQPDVPPNDLGDLVSAAFTLSGLRYTEDRYVHLFRELSMTLEDSTGYQWILRKGVTQGQLREASDLVRRLGGKRFGSPSAEAEVRLAAVTDLDRLHRITDRIFDAVSWDDLLSTP